MREPWACCAMAALPKIPGSAARAGLGGCVGREGAGTRQVMHRRRVNKPAKMAVFHGREAQSCRGLKPAWAVPKARGAVCARAAATCFEGENSGYYVPVGKRGVPLDPTEGRGVAPGRSSPASAASSRGSGKCFRTCSSLLFCSHIFFFFSPLSVFPTHVLLPEPILIMHDFFFFL